MTRLLLLAVTALTLAWITTNLAGIWLAAPLPMPGDRPPPPRRLSFTRPLDGAALEHRFGLGRTPLPPRPDGRLRGTLVATLEGASLALIESGPRAVVVRVGDPWNGFTVDQIERRRVWLVSAEGRTALESGEAVASAVEPPPRVRRTPSGVFEVPRAEVERLLADPIRLAAQAFFTPSANGWIISRLAPDSALRDLGVLPGDEIRAFNGRAANKLETLLGAVQALPAARRVEIDVVRAGAPLRLEYDLR
jgi:type II secretory pathway component PulC